MMHRLLALAGALLLASCGAPEEQHDWPAPSPALWEVTAPDGKAGWLFGTVHALPAGLEWETPALDAALDESGELVVEIADLSDGKAAARAFNAAARSPGLPELLQRVPAKDRPALEHLLDTAGMDESDFTDVESWAASIMLTSAVRGPYDPGNGADRVLIARKGRATGLESFERQYRIFDRLPQEDQAELLSGAAEGLEDDRIARLTAWLTGDLDALSEEVRSGIMADPELREALLLARNREWAARIAPMIEAGRRPFVAVGTAHVVGEGSLPELLAARGFTVRRVQ